MFKEEPVPKKDQTSEGVSAWRCLKGANALKESFLIRIIALKEPVPIRGHSLKEPVLKMSWCFIGASEDKEPFVLKEVEPQRS